MNNYDIIVVGAGPSGILAAGHAAELGARVLLLEKMERPGRKLLITGKGRCNVTNNLSISDFITHVFPNGRFLKPAFSSFFSQDIIRLLSEYNVELTLERGGRYFPVSNQSKDVLEAFIKWMDRVGVEIRCGEKVIDLEILEGKVTGLKTESGILNAKCIVLATGGKSYPATGSNGEAFDLVRRYGHTIEKTRPALVPLETKGNIAQRLQGLNLRNVKATLWVDSKKVAEDFGEMIFTHFGLSGPIILTLSRLAVDALSESRKVEAIIDLKPALDEQKLDQRLIRDLDEHGKKHIGNIFKYWLPATMIPVFIDLLGIDPDKECHQVSSKERKQIRYLLKNFPFTISHNRSFKEAIITAGGVSLKEISSKQMASKLIKGLFFAGEMIDLDAETGGFNLQIAYSTGWLAGESAVKSLEESFQQK